MDADPCHIVWLTPLILTASIQSRTAEVTSSGLIGSGVISWCCITAFHVLRWLWKTAAGSEEGNWLMHLFVIYMVMWRCFQEEYLCLQIFWRISDKGQSCTLFTCYVETDAPICTSDLWEKKGSQPRCFLQQTHTLARQDPRNRH